MKIQPTLLRSILLPALLLLAVLLVAAVSGQQDPETFRGREIAPVMTYHGAPWLERESRIQEEDPEALHAALPIEPGDTVVDLGCGSGYHARRLAKAVGEEGRVLCVDIQPEMLDIAERLAGEEGLGNIEYVLSEPGDPKLPAREIDLILLVDVYHEFATPAPMLAAMREALSEKGRVALVEFRLEGESARHIKLEHRMSIEQVMKEWLPAGYRLDRRIDSLPSQHLFLFVRDE